MRDVSELYLHIVVRDPQIVAIPTHQLTVEFKRDSGESYLGAFNDAQVAELQGQDVLIYRFSFTPEIIPELMPLIGANLTCMLWAESDTEFHTVAKLELARMLGGNSAFPGWDEAVCSLWPSARLLYSGHANLGIAMEADDE
jgi:hypothetical protein